jgi:hypothetical protein
VKKINFGRYLFCFLLVLFSSDVRAQPGQLFNTTGNAFYAQCTQQSPMYANCVYYLIGFQDGMNFFSPASYGRSSAICLRRYWLNSRIPSSSWGADPVGVSFALANELRE